VAQPTNDRRPVTDEQELAVKVVVIGGTGLIGSKGVAILRRGGHEAIRCLTVRRQFERIG
jgi:nucleoside-diphosphate-sugar epimerase